MVKHHNLMIIPFMFGKSPFYPVGKSPLPAFSPRPAAKATAKPFRSSRDRELIGLEWELSWDYVKNDDDMMEIIH
jgi:hypothetical protein